ncbi:hypothetical protein TeGR_g2616, partial [Tetraparma gracilis]
EEEEDGVDEAAETELGLSQGSEAEKSDEQIARELQDAYDRERAGGGEREEQDGRLAREMQERLDGGGGKGGGGEGDERMARELQKKWDREEEMSRRLASPKKPAAKKHKGGEGGSIKDFFK